MRSSVPGSNLLVEASSYELPKVAHAVSRGSSTSKNRNGLHPYASVHEKATNIPGPESHPYKNSDDAWAGCPRISLPYTAHLTGHFQFGRDPRLFIVAPCIQMELHYKELSPNEEAHFSDTGDVPAAVRSNRNLRNSGRLNDPEHFNIVTEDGAAASGTVQIAGDYGYPQSGIVLPNNPTASGEYLNPIINILSTTYTGNFGDPTRTVTFVFNSTENLYGYTWAGTFTANLICYRYYRGRCSAYTPGAGSGTMIATAVQ